MEVLKLSIEEQHILLMQLRKKEVYAKAKTYDKVNKPPKLDHQEIVEIVKSARKNMSKGILTS